MNSNSSASKEPDGSTQIDHDQKAKLDSLPDGSQSDGTAESDNDTASGGPAE